MDSLKDLKQLRYITVHASGGLEMLKAVTKKAKKINKNIKVLAVTILTSLNNKSLKEMGHTKSVDQLVLKQAALIKKSGAAGCVCSAREAKLIRKKYKNLFIVTPGIRLPGDKTNDQARVETPANAFNNKVSAIVMGRSLVSGKTKNNLKRLINHLN
jgi:orotidine-5'-phosphate decarboxylase